MLTNYSLSVRLSPSLRPGRLTMLNGKPATVPLPAFSRNMAGLQLPFTARSRNTRKDSFIAHKIIKKI